MSDKNIDEIHGEWTFKRIGKNIYKIYRTVAPHCIAMTGANVTTQLPIPFPHRWIRLTFFHMNAAYAAITNSELGITFKRTQASLDPPHFEETVYFDEARTDPYITARAGETYEYEPSVYDLILLSNNTDLIQPVFYLQKLESP